MYVRELGSSGTKTSHALENDAWPLWNLKWWLLPLSLSATRIGIWFIAGRLFECQGLHANIHTSNGYWLLPTFIEYL